ncbi:uncharacterized protein LOC142530433 [Primulina tabacum]|uniref:uncharacterized protein LOC142530433 n=1 Tax=Primulina tabacum TaxID=48773 RepID=UPI003F5A1E0B
MAPKLDIGWEFGKSIGGDRKTIQCKFCGKIITGGITRLKQHIAHVAGNVESCTKAPKEISLMFRKHLQDTKNERNLIKKKKEIAINAIQQSIHGLDNCSDSGNDDKFDNTYEETLEDMENRALRKAMKESCRTRAFEEDMQNRYGNVSGSSSSQSANPNLRKQMTRSFSKRKSIKNWFAPEKVKDVGKAISKWFIYNAIPFHAADSGPYYKAMINTIANVGPGVQGPSGRQIGGVFREEEVEDITIYLNTLKSKWPKYGCTIMCDGWSTRNKHPIINFMIYCDRNMIFHSSVDCTNKRKTADFILSLLNNVIDDIGEENVVHVVTDSESANKAAGQKLMIERPHMFWSPCAAHCIDLMLEDIDKMTKVKRCIDKAKQITSFIYNSDKIVNLMKIYTNDRELLRPGITRFATEFISLESLVRYCQDLKRLCTSVEWREYNNTSKRRKDVEKITAIILDTKFWKAARDICTAMEPLVKVLKLVDQDNKPTLSIIYEAMDRAKLSIKESVKD